MPRLRVLVTIAAATALVAAPMMTASAAPSGPPPDQPPQTVDVTPPEDADLTPPDATEVPLVAASQVCVIDCDGGNPEDAESDVVPVDEVTIGERTLSLHTSPSENLGWAGVTGATAGDRVWIERSWDHGGTREQPLPPVTAETPEAATSTVNLSDPTTDRRGIVRACLDPVDGAEAECTEWAYRSVCEGTCDGYAPADDAVAEQPVPTATLTQRSIDLNLDAEGLAWATLTGGTAGDEVWIERSWNGGTSAPGGTFLGRTSVPDGSTDATSAAYNTRDTRAKLYGGVARACGRVASSQATACTQWARSSSDRAGAAADALMFSYQPHEAWWRSSWWNSAVAIHTVIDYQATTGDDTYDWAIDRTFEINRQPFPAGEKSTDEIEGNFLSRAIDDAGWWGLAWIAAYDLTGDEKYLDMAVIIGDYMYEYWDEDVCDGGVYWDRESTYKNAVTNGQFIRLTAELHNRIPGDSTWLHRSTTAWDWFDDSGMINDDGLINDGLNSDTCENNGQTVWTYNQGLMIGAGVELWRATGNDMYLETSRYLADAAIDSDELVTDGVLTESCDALDETCDDNQKQFKGIFMRYLDDLDEVTGGEYRTFVDFQAETIWTEGSDALNRVGVRWTGEGTPEHPNNRDWRTQASALGAILAAS